MSIFFLSFCILVQSAQAQTLTPSLKVNSVNPKVVNWLKSNLSSTGLPFSFQIPENKRKEAYLKMEDSFSVTGIVERMIVGEGTSIYDIAVWQIVLTMLGGKENLERAFSPVNIYWQGQLGELYNIRAGFSGQPFVYNPHYPGAVTSNLKKFGKRGFVFRILNANGKYRTEDPLDGKTESDGFPNSARIHWEDWKPIAGENAWVVISALQLFHKKYYQGDGTYQKSSKAIELSLAKEIARAGLFLQARNGGIRMAPLGTYYYLIDIDETLSMGKITQQLDDYAKKVSEGEVKRSEKKRYIKDKAYLEHHIWYYEEISSENNLSWYAALRMLYDITGKKIYKMGMRDIESYMKSVWNPKENYFYQGAHFVNGKWQSNTKHFATDVQNWAIIVLGPKKLDQWFGVGTAYKIWRATKRISGVVNKEGDILGVGFSREKERISIEWTAGAIFALRALVNYYQESHPSWAKQAERDIKTMRNAMETYKIVVSESEESYSYSSRRDWIPFGWFSHDPEVLSLVSSAWIVLVDTNFNPFYFPK
ncbi:MAG: hypothetical protein P9M07_07665 [Candidatus Aceula meridiana]|nr:hypothetical protein [Candidatus Aceula meridiana]